MMGANDYLALHAQRQPLAPAATDLERGHSWTYQSFDGEAWRYARYLQSLGLGAGARVAVLAKNRPELIILHFACARLGALYVPLNWRLASQELTQLIDDAEPQLLLGDECLAASGLTGASLNAFAQAACQAEPLPPTRVDTDANSLILYTSGTSGRPKGVLLSEGNLWQSALNFSVLGCVTAASAVLCDTPMFHIIGLVINVRPVLMQGGRLLVSGGFFAERTLSRLGDAGLGITHYFCVPQMAAMLRASPAFDAAKLRGLTAVFSGGAPHAGDAIRRWTLHGLPMCDGFGMSETGTVSCMPLDLELIEAHAGSAGLVPPGIEIRIVDDRGADVETGAVGELLVGGPSVTTGYWRRPEETRSAFTANGWLRSGDLARLDKDGFLWLVDRKKDMFISGGEHIYPAEIEQALAGHAAIAECAVIGVPDAQWGEVGHLFVVAVPGRRVDSADVIAHLESRVARYKIPKKISVLDQLPRNGAGKVLKHVLRKLLAAP